jgi:hypothetical protein
MESRGFEAHLANDVDVASVCFAVDGPQNGGVDDFAAVGDHRFDRQNTRYAESRWIVEDWAGDHYRRNDVAAYSR